MSTPENAMMFLNNYTLTICASTGIWVYRTAALPSAPILQYTIQDADIDNWNFTQTTQWFMTPMGNLYTILANATANSNNTEYAIFRPYMPYVSSILAFNPTGYTTNDSVVFTPFSTPAADFLICQNPPMANDNKFGLNYVPYQ